MCMLFANYVMVDLYLNVTHVFSIQGLVNLNAVPHTQLELVPEYK